MSTGSSAEWALAAAAVHHSVVADPSSAAAPTSLQHVLETFSDPVASSTEKDTAVVAHAIAARERACAALLSIAALRLRKPPVSEPAASPVRSARPLPKAADSISRGSRLLSAVASSDPPPPPIASTSCAAAFASHLRAAREDALSGPVRVNLGPSVPPGAATASVVSRLATAETNEFLRKRAASRQAARWTAAEAPQLRELGVALVLYRSAGGGVAPCDPDGCVALVWPGFFSARLSCGDGAPQVVAYTSQVSVAGAPGQPSASAAPDDVALVQAEVTSAFHSRGTAAGLLALKGAAAGLVLDLLSDQAAAAAQRRTVIGSLRVRRAATEVAGPEPGVRLFLGDASSTAGQESCMVRFAVDPRRYDVIGFVSKENGNTSAAGVRMPPDAPRPRSTFDPMGFSVEVSVEEWARQLLFGPSASATA